MISALGWHLFESTILAAIAAILTRCLRNRRAAARHSLWLLAAVSAFTFGQRVLAARRSAARLAAGQAAAAGPAEPAAGRGSPAVGTGGRDRESPPRG